MTPRRKKQSLVAIRRPYGKKDAGEFEEEEHLDEGRLSESAAVDEIVDEAEGIPDSDGRLQEAFTYFKKEIGRYPLLTPEEEGRLARLKAQGDQEARDRLIFSNLRLVVAVVSRIVFLMGQNSILGFMDLIQEGVVGLIVAVDRFDHNYGTRFSTYGVPWIYQSVKVALLKHRHGITVPGMAGNALYYMKGYIEDYRSGRDIPDKYFKRVRDLSRLVLTPLSMYEAAEDEDSNCLDLSWAVFDFGEDIDGQINRKVMCERLMSVLEEELDEQDLDIIKRRFGLEPYSFPLMLEDIAKAYGKSMEYVRKRLDTLLQSLRRNSRLREYYREYMQI